MTFAQKLDWLINQWCERRELQPLRYLLQAYPSVLALSDDFHKVLEALRDVKGLCRNQLTPDELAHVISCINELEDRLTVKK